MRPASIPPPTSSVETPDPTAGAPGNQRDSIAEGNEGGTEKSVEPSFRQACHCESEAQRALKPGPTRMRNNDNQTLHGGPKECDEKFTKSKDRNDEDVDESDSEYQDQDEEDTEDGEDEDEDDGPRSRKRPRQSSEDSDGFRNHSHGETSSKIRVSQAHQGWSSALLFVGLSPEWHWHDGLSHGSVSVTAKAYQYSEQEWKKLSCCSHSLEATSDGVIGAQGRVEIHCTREQETHPSEGS